MKHVCPDCGYESTDPGNCPSCETPLLKREDEVGASAEDTEKIDDDIELDKDDIEDEEGEEW